MATQHEDPPVAKIQNALSRKDTVTITQAQKIYVSWFVDVLIYVVVLNLFVEYVPNVVIDSFTISILTAILLKVLLATIMHFEHRVHHRLEQKEGRVYRILTPVVMFAILFFSKFLLLEIVDFVFGEHVELGHLIEVVFLVIALVAAREISNRIYLRLGRDR